jgi:haloalkane dehalogenase
VVNYPYPFRPRKLDIGGHNLSYIDEGKGRPVVMVHGNPTWSFYYRNLAESLKSKYRVIALDHLGCGLSDKPQDYAYTLENHIKNLTTLIEKLNLEDISLVMHDWGGAIGMGFAGQHPEKISSLSVLNTAAFTSNKIPWRISICRAPILGTLLLRGLNAFSRAAVYMAVSKPMPPEVICGYLAPYDSWHNRVAVDAFVHDIPLHENHPSWSTLVEVEKNLVNLAHIPMQIIWGGRDFCFNNYFYEEWCRRFPKARQHYFPEAGHYVLEDAFSQIAPLFDEFYGGL